jgi:hypothetical protein
VSFGGLAAFVDQPIPVGEAASVELALMLDNESLSESLAVPARVVWCTALNDEFQVGLSFLGLDGKTRQYLQIFLRYLESGRDELESDEDSLDNDPTDVDPFSS